MNIYERILVIDQAIQNLDNIIAHSSAEASRDNVVLDREAYNISYLQGLVRYLSHYNMLQDMKRFPDFHIHVIFLNFIVHEEQYTPKQEKANGTGRQGLTKPVIFQFNNEIIT